MTKLSDSEIRLLFEDPKPITPNFRDWLSRVGKFRNGPQLRYGVAMTSLSGRKFAVHLRRHETNYRDFSVGLRWKRTRTDSIQLVRCNGWHAEHRNRLERGKPNYKIPANTCHVHMVSERYMCFEDDKSLGYAVAVDYFECIDQALCFLVDKFGFVSRADNSPFNIYPLFGFEY